jgi:hypothetical protein
MSRSAGDIAFRHARMGVLDGFQSAQIEVSFKAAAGLRQINESGCAMSVVGRRGLVEGAIWGGVVRLPRSIAGTCKTWLAPLIIAIMIFAALFFFVGGSMDIPFLYRSAK